MFVLIIGIRALFDEYLSVFLELSSNQFNILWDKTSYNNNNNNNNSDFIATQNNKQKPLAENYTNNGRYK